MVEAFPSFPVAAAQSRPLSDTRLPSHDGHRFPSRSAAVTTRAVPELLLAVSFRRSRHCPCRRRLYAPVRSQHPECLSLAGFQVTLIGRIWASAEAEIS